ncbi:NAD(P)-dependent dehydrogenase (short-subunit alcohol dehydrogenase family) [Tamaricihabitans halophyticus]|uniref:NAD(P)-dependent dehydrogenase (Short-subunit alcohol dehydrogenase family) n=1 Tax=Tamaricihabitans halophyticus TaxID=1262583 RepID=A0A4R2QFI1_9PSEU|nr:SDR family oxidoreductase [Tamaricihabitans halophyticus]TCP47264.1 NAD(P)-dependent dehydrogenase (short-subunit alcohol dehydrogenase family) [Tamaricihabitans halophyticus]
MERAVVGSTPLPTDSAALLDLEGRVAVVTGASRGIGKATAEIFARMGAGVALVSRREEMLADAAGELVDKGATGAVRYYVANAGEPDQVEETVQTILADFGHIDILINNAATNPYYGRLTGLDFSRAAKTAQVNLIGPVMWTRHAWAASMRAHGGAVVNVASLGAYTVERGAGFYAATKAALVNLTKQLAAELGPCVRVNAIAPGLVKTDMARVLWEGKEDEIASALPARRLGIPADIAQATLFLVSDAASWITGHTLVVDGGALAMPLIGMDH